MSEQLKILRRANFDWTVMLQNVWSQPLGDVSRIHEALRQEFADQLEDLSDESNVDSPAGWVINGTGGSGKTHLLGRFRAMCDNGRACFVLVDMTDVRDFWDTVLLGYFTSLQQNVDGRPQYESLIENVLHHLNTKVDVRQVLAALKERKTIDLKKDCEMILSALRKQAPQEVLLHGDTIRSLVALNSADYSTANLGSAWLQGEAIEPEEKVKLGLTKESEKSQRIVEGLAWLMSLNGPTVVAFDQLDPIITQFALQLEKKELDADQDLNSARAILNQIGSGLSGLRDLTAKFRTLIVISCVEMSWETLKNHASKTYTDRFERPRVLKTLPNVEVVRQLISQRLAPAFLKANFTPPYQTWPFSETAIAQMQDDTPREILQKCKDHVRSCLERGQVEELASFRTASKPDATVVPPANDNLPAFSKLDETFATLVKAANVNSLLDEDNEDDSFAELVQKGLQVVLQESRLPVSIDGMVDIAFTGGMSNKPLHARVRLVFNAEHSREEHVCVRVLQKANPKAFQSRLIGAITQSGIDKALPFRRLVIVRSTGFPGGKVTQELIKRFVNQGGIHLTPSESDLRTLSALASMSDKADPLLESWLQARRHASQTVFMRVAVPRVLELALPQEVAPPTPNKKEDRPVPTPPVVVTKPITPVLPAPTNGATPPPSGDLKLHLGRRLTGSTLGPALEIPIKSLDQHGVVFAGAGSGKSVLLKRLVEEAALARIPAIVIDCANDLCALGSVWPVPPTAWSPGDAELAARLKAETETIVWTPGRESGNPIGLAPLPDLHSLVDSPDELGEATTMALESLEDSLITGSESVKSHRRAILLRSLNYLAQHGGCTLESLAELLTDLPPEVTAKISDERKIAKKMSDDLRAQLVNNPLLRSGGPVLDPALLFGDDGVRAKTRISVINFVGLPTLDGQRQFLNQLAMTLFSWIKKNPKPPDRPLRGLLILDEARDFIPSQRSSACLGSFQRLAAQARKYKLGVIFATQNPKDIDTKIVGQCSTQWYGKMNSPVAIQAAEEMLRERGMPNAEVGALPNGVFFASNADAIKTPLKIKTSFCLSEHGAPWEKEQVLIKAASTRLTQV